MKKARYSLRERLLYAFDNVMSRGPVALIGWLALLTILITLVVTLVAWVVGAVFADNFPDQLWRSLMFTITMFDPTEGYEWAPRVALFLLLIVGIFATSTLIGLLTTSIEGRIENLRKGRSRVIERGHTVILGWNPMIFPVISELVKANANRRSACIVILAGKDKVEMEEEVRDKIDDFANTRVVCRTGSPMEITDLAIASINNARSLIILPPLEDPSDAGIIKILLAITRNSGRREGLYNIVAEIGERSNLEVAKIISRDEVELISAAEFISRIMAQTCRQSGLSVVYTELFQFEGDEIYIKTESQLAGASFKQALFAYKKCAVIGIASPREGILLNPPPDRQITADDRIIAIAEDDSAFFCAGVTEPELQGQFIHTPADRPCAPENILILGWNRRAPAIIAELDQYMTRGSRLRVIAEYEPGELQQQIRKLGSIERVEFLSGDITDRGVLEAQPLAEIQHVIILPYTELYSEKQADARTLNTLLHLRDLGSLHCYAFSIVSEMLDVRNRELAEADRPDDFVVSDSLISMVLAQVSENRSLAPIFSTLLNHGGVEIYLRCAGRYLKTGSTVNFYTVVEAASRRGEIAIGYRLAAEQRDPGRKYGIYLNPVKDARVKLEEDDQVIVIAEV